MELSPIRCESGQCLIAFCVFSFGVELTKYIYSLYLATGFGRLIVFLHMLYISFHLRVTVSN